MWNERAVGQIFIINRAEKIGHGWVRVKYNGIVDIVMLNDRKHGKAIQKGLNATKDMINNLG